jgi:hypothetical protein
VIEIFPQKKSLANISWKNRIFLEQNIYVMLFFVTWVAKKITTEKTH